MGAPTLIGALPVVGLLARIFADEGGVGDDIVDFAEFRRRVGKKCGVTDSQAFYEFRDRRGRAGDPLYVLLCCWLAAVGAGLLKSEEIFEGVARLRISNDIEFEEETFLAMMNAAKEKRATLKSPPPEIPMEIRAEKALEGIYVCCFGQDPIEEEDAKLLRTILNAVFRQSEDPRLIGLLLPWHSKLLLVRGKAIRVKNSIKRGRRAANEGPRISATEKREFDLITVFVTKVLSIYLCRRKFDTIKDFSLPSRRGFVIF
uniref:Photosystem I assembly factor PSA3, chloroplastic n=1 Tax=Ananas comosus var. bracteatus TaxID=296719 RepID=A0A6V7NZS0_ANACO|nr:unnamed protein product [Ananas comosus var. bracteatus]